MKTNIRSLKQIINKECRRAILESSLSRTYDHIQKHDCAIVSAFRGDPTDKTKCLSKSMKSDPGSSAGKNVLSINKTRNRNLKALLLQSGYGVTSVDGSFIENFGQSGATEVNEDSFFVVNLSDDPAFKKNISKLGELFCQDSVLFIPQGGEEAYLIGTNESEFPGYGNKVSVGSLHMGKESEFMTRVGNRPYVFKENLQTYNKLSRLERLAVQAIARKYVL